MRAGPGAAQAMRTRGSESLGGGGHGGDLGSKPDALQNPPLNLLGPWLQTVALQCPHWALAAPAPRRSSPSVHRFSARRFIRRQWNVHPCALFPRCSLALRALQGHGYIPVTGHSLPRGAIAGPVRPRVVRQFMGLRLNKIEWGQVCALEGREGGTGPPARAPSPCPAPVPLTPSARLDGCNRQ